MREYSSFINFAQVENATFGFIMDSIISEINSPEKVDVAREKPFTFENKNIYSTTFYKEAFVEPH